jgi:hypothetical protein
VIVPHDDERELRRFLREAHAELDPAPPEFAATLSAARRRGDLHRAGRRRHLRLVAAAAALLVALAVSIRFVRSRPAAPEVGEALRQAAALGEWRAPSDFLASLPGAEGLESTPRFGSTGELQRSLSAAIAAEGDPKGAGRGPSGEPL